MKCCQEEMSAVPRNVYIVEMTLRILTTAENILFWMTRQSGILQMFSHLTLSIANADPLAQFITICPQN